MKTNSISSIFFLILISCNSLMTCQPSSSGRLSGYKIDGNDVKHTKLPKELKEISGLAYAREKFVFTHNDEEGIVYKVDFESGIITKKFILGNKILKKDFEGIAVVGDSIFLTTSDGVLYRFKEVENNGNSDYKKYKTGLTAKNNIEGLCYDEKTNSLLLACKGSAGKKLKGFKAVYSYNLDNYKLNTNPRFLINLESLNSKFSIKNFSPTGIEVNPDNGNFFILSSIIESIIELSADGELLSAVKLDPKENKQPEGITFASDLSLVVSNEGQNKKGKITIVPSHK
ncbi:MAG: SdiA-regulated domain-containing protein [Ignavibacterium sp.]|nr:MAG: SdiA-regulated domain-containing protein [Ignavibacterium sp.]